MEKEPLPELHGDYYVDNFHTLTSFVESTYKDLLTEQELQWCGAIRCVQLPAQRLYIRLLTRRGSTFRVSRLTYPEVGDAEQAASLLSTAELATRSPPEDMNQLLGCFTKPELLDTLSLQVHRNLSRSALCDQITNASDEEQRHYRECLQASDGWVNLHGHAHWMLMQLCFFGNLYQDSSQFVMQQLGTLTYESYVLDPSARAFTSRSQIEAHWRYFECEALFDVINLRSGDDLLNLASSLPQTHSQDHNLIRRVDRLRNKIARQLERLSLVEQAQGLYEASVRPPARERRVRILMARPNWQQALLLAQQMLDVPLNESERLVAQRLVEQCSKSQGLPYQKHRAFKPVSSKLVLRNTGQRVEEMARRFYSLNGECFHTENTLVTAVLGLLIWDIIFQPLPGVFFNPFQTGPCDFNEPEFRHRRATLLDARFEELDDPQALLARVQSSYQAHHGKQNPLVRWQRVSPTMLELALERIPSAHWRALFNRVLDDSRENSTGLPDLVLFPNSGGYEFIEIKGPGDTLQANQRRWMHYFSEHAIACRVVHVRYSLDSIETSV